MLDGVPRLMSFLSVLQLSDSAFPSGRYTLSHGLEGFAASGKLQTPTNPLTLLALLCDYIRFAVAPSDGVALACAHRAVDVDGSVDLVMVRRADDRLSAVKLGLEARESSMRTGRALLGTATAAFGTTALQGYAALVDVRETPGNHAVVLGLLSARLGVPCVEAVAGELYAFCASWVAAAIRLAMTDHRTAQCLLHEVRRVTVDAALAAVGRDISHISSCAPLLDVMAMRHEQAELRLFAN